MTRPLSFHVKVICIIAVLNLWTYAGAQEIQDGDIIFQNSPSRQSLAISPADIFDSKLLSEVAKQ